MDFQCIGGAMICRLVPIDACCRKGQVRLLIQYEKRRGSLGELPGFAGRDGEVE